MLVNLRPLFGRPGNIWLPSFSLVIQLLHCRRRRRRRPPPHPPIFHSHSIKRNFSSATIIIQSPPLPRRLPACCLRPRPPPRAQDAICLSVKQRTDGRGRHRGSVARPAASVASSSSSIYRLPLNYTRMKCRSLSLPPLLRWKSSSDFWLSFRYFSKAVAAAAIDLAYIIRKRQLNFSFTSDRPEEIRPRASERRGAASCVWLSVGQLIAYCFTISLLIKCVRRRAVLAPSECLSASSTSLFHSLPSVRGVRPPVRVRPFVSALSIVNLDCLL